MSVEAVYKLCIRVETPASVVEGEAFPITYHVMNIGKTTFPPGTISVRVSWANLGPNALVNHPISIDKPLRPSDHFEDSTTETPMASGYTMFTPNFPPGQARDHGYVQMQKGRLFFYLEDGRQLLPNMLCGSVRARSQEEVYQKQELETAREELRVATRTLRWAIYAFAATIAFGLIDLLLKFWLNG